MPERHAHAGSHLACLCGFPGTAIAAVYAGLLPEKAGGYISSFLSLLAVAAVFPRAPVAHPNNPKSAKSLARFKRIGRIFVVTECAAALINCEAVSLPHSALHTAGKWEKLFTSPPLCSIIIM